MENSKKQEAEKRTLMQAFSAKMNTKDRKLLESFLGQKEAWAVGWKCEDRPDLIRESDNYVVGIEHFEVDGLSQKRKNKYQHLTSRFENKKQDMIDKYVGKIDNYTEKEQLEIYGKLFYDTYDFFQEHLRQDSENVIYDLLESLFTENGKGHAQKCKIYKEKLNKEYGKPAKIGILIELFGDFTNLVIFDGKEYKVNDNGYFPLSKDILWLLSCALMDESLDFVIFYRRFNRGGVLHNLNAKTIVMNEPIDVNMLKSFRGEVLCEKLPFGMAKKENLRSELYVRYRDDNRMVDIVGDGNREETIDIRMLWNLVRNGQEKMIHKCPYYTENELASVIYALCQIPHEWLEVEYVDNSRLKNGKIKNDTRKGYSPTIYDPNAFWIQMSSFQWWFERKIRKVRTVEADSDFENDVLQISEKYDVSDNSQGEWIQIKKKKSKKT